MSGHKRGRCFYFHHAEMLNLCFLSLRWLFRAVCGPDRSTVEQRVTVESSKEEDLLKLYHQSFDDELVDLDLIMDLLHYICSTSSDGALPAFYA